MSKDSLHQDLESLVGANLNIERFVQFVVQLWSFNSYMKAEVPGFFLSVGPFWVACRILVIHHLGHLLKLSSLLRVQKLATGHHVLEMLMEALAHHALVVHSHHGVVVLETLVVVSLPIIVWMH